MWWFCKRLQVIACKTIQTMLCALVVLAITPASALAGSVLSVSSSGILITQEAGLDMNGQLITSTMFGAGPGTLGLSSYIYNEVDPRLTSGVIVQTAMEFNVSSLSGPVNSAILSLYVSDAFVNQIQIGTPNGFPMFVGFSGAEFAGTGQVTQSNFAAAGTTGADAAINPNSNFATTIYPFNIDVTDFVNALVKQGDQFAGFSLSTLDIDIGGAVTIDFATQASLQPTLTINGPAPFAGPILIASVPEPSSYVLLGLGLVFVALACRFQRRRGSPLRHAAR